MKNILIVNRNFHELNPIVVGERHCAPGYGFGPFVRNFTLIHYIISGTGILHLEGREYTVKAGEAFLIPPGEVSIYTSSKDDPWVYRWIGFNGALSEKFLSLPRVFTTTSGAFEKIGEIIRQRDMLEYRLCAALFELYSDLFSGKKKNNHYVRRVCDFINTSYMQPISVEMIAESMNLDRRYLTRIFKERMGQTMQEYIISVRLEAARESLLGGASVSEAAMLCGYADECNFSKMFKRRYGISPGAWRRQNEKKVE